MTQSVAMMAQNRRPRLAGITSSLLSPRTSMADPAVDPVVGAAFAELELAGMGRAGSPTLRLSFKRAGSYGSDGSILFGAIDQLVMVKDGRREAGDLCYMAGGDMNSRRLLFVTAAKVAECPLDN